MTDDVYARTHYSACEAYKFSILTTVVYNSHFFQGSLTNRYFRRRASCIVRARNCRLSMRLKRWWLTIFANSDLSSLRKVTQLCILNVSLFSESFSLLLNLFINWFISDEAEEYFSEICHLNHRKNEVSF